MIIRHIFDMIISSDVTEYLEKNKKKNYKKNLKNPGITMRKQREPGQTIIAHRLTDPAIT